MQFDPDSIVIGEDFIHLGVGRSLNITDLRRHLYVPGKTGMGKSSFLRTLMAQLVHKGHGVGLIDPHGDLAESFLDHIHKSRINDVAYFNPADRAFPVGFNPLRQVTPDYQHLVVDDVTEACRAIWHESWGPRLERILKETIAALIETPGATLLGIRRMLTDRDYRTQIMEEVRDPETIAFWRDEFPIYEKGRGGEALTPVLNKIGEFVASPIIRNIIGQTKSTIDHRHVMDNSQIFVANLAKGKIGTGQSHLLGAFLVTSFAQAALARAELPEEDRRDFVLIIDEFQNFSTESFQTILSEARKYRLCLVIAHQYQEQLDEGVIDAIVGNVGSIISFAQGYKDAEDLVKAFDGELKPSHLTDLDAFQTYVRLARGAGHSGAMKLNMIDPRCLPRKMRGEEIKRQSRRRFGKPRKFVEERVNRRLRPIAMQVTKKPKKVQQRSKR